MSSESSESVAYAQLCDTVTNNDNLHHIHFGCSRKQLEESFKMGTEEITTSSPFEKDTTSVAYYYAYEKICDGNLSKGQKLNNIEIKSDEICLEFSLNDSSHGLTAFTISNILPKVVAHEGYQVRWCHNVGSHIVKYGIFTHAKVKIHDFDDITSDILLTYPQKGEDIDSINIDIGNTTDLQTFSNVLQQKPVIFIPSFPFNNSDPSYQFPLYMCANQDDIKVSLILKKDPQSLLIIAKENKDGTLEIIKPEKGKRYVDLYQDGEEISKFEFKYPTVVTQYDFMSQDECNGKWCNSGLEKSVDTNQRIDFYVNQATPFAAKNPISDATTVIDEINTSHVVTSIAWMAEQIQNREKHILSNYTTNPNPNFLDSVSPIISTTIYTGKSTILDKMPAISTCKIASRHSYRRTPCLPGIHIRTLGIRGCDNTTKPGFIFDKGTMTFVLKETDPLVSDKTRSKTTDLYDVHVRVFCRIPFGFTVFASSKDERSTKDKSIITAVNTLINK